MHPNWMIAPTVGLALALFALSERWMIRLRGWAWIWMLPVALVLATPGLLYTLYYLHLFDNAAWFYSLRALPYSELFAAGLGVACGMVQSLTRGRRWLALASRTSVLGLMCYWLAVPYMKSFLMPANLASFRDTWDNNVCLQSYPASCGPASAATVLRHFGVTVTERELAAESFTSFTGTENWYLARALRRRGFTVRYRILPMLPDPLPVPCIAGTRLNTPGGPGHFIALLDYRDGHYLVGDPLVGAVQLPERDRRPYHFTGFFLLITPGDQQCRGKE